MDELSKAYTNKHIRFDNWTIYNLMKDAILILNDGTKFHGKSFGYEAEVEGDHIFSSNIDRFYYDELEEEKKKSLVVEYGKGTQ